MASVVLKFGGTSVGDAAAIGRLADIVAREVRPRLVVVSALSGVTDLLVTLGDLASAGDAAGVGRVLERLRSRHATLAAEAVTERERATLTPTLDATLDELHALTRPPDTRVWPSPRDRDAVHACGEQLSSRLITAALRSRHIDAIWIDATDVLVTDDTHGRAHPDVDATTAALTGAVSRVFDGSGVPVIGGYIGATPDGVTTTLGRGGSDYSASLFGAALGAAEIQIWTDVDGMLTADPRIVPTAHLVPHLSFAEAAELAYFGAKVLHPSSVQPAVRAGIPVRILNAANPDGVGTTISVSPPPRVEAMTALASKRGVTVIEITSARMLMAHGFLQRLFAVFDRLETAVNVVTTSEVNVSVTVDDTDRLDALVAELRRFAEVVVEPQMALLCVVGENLHEDARLFGQIVTALGAIPVRMVSQSASRRTVTFVLRESDLPQALAGLHDRFFPPPPKDAR